MGIIITNRLLDIMNHLLIHYLNKSLVALPRVNPLRRCAT